MFDIFINYRKSDARFGAAAVFELLTGHFERSTIFLDNQSMGPGAVYPSRIRAALESMHVLVVLIGPNWLTGSDDGPSLLDRDGDWVRREIVRAIERKVPIVPVLLDGVALPDPGLLPEDVRPLLHRQVAEVRYRSLGADVGRLALHLAELVPAGGLRGADGQGRGDDIRSGTVGFERVPVPRQLPPGSAHFVGREAELERLDSRLRDSDAQVLPIVVLSGTAGVGKTALALRWAHKVAAQFPDGQLYVDLHGFAPGEPVSPMEALSSFLRALGLTRPEELTGLAERSARFRTLMSSRRAIVVLDNAYSAQQVEPLLPGAGPAVVVVTSRVLLGELYIRHAATAVRLEPLPPVVGIRLLAADMADRVVQEKTAADRISMLCAGLPLALRIASERLVSRPNLGLAALADELDDERSRLASLSSEVDVRAVFSWSYRQLDKLTARVFRAIGLGPQRGFDAAVIAAVAACPVSVAAQALIELSRAHLVTELVGGRYGMHDLLRAYAGELASDEADPFPRHGIRRMFDYYLRSTDRANQLLTPHRTRIPLTGDQTAGRDFPDATAAHRWLQAEEPNLIALSRLDDPELDTYRWQLAYVLRDYFYLTKKLDGWIETHANALAAARRSGTVRATALTRNNLGMAMTAANRLEEAMRLFRAAKEVFERVGDRMGASNALANIASVLRRQGDPAVALTYQQRALTYYRATGTIGHVGITLRGMASAHLQLGQAIEAVKCAQEAVDIATWLSHDLDIAQANNILGTAHRLGGDLTLAGIAYQHALDRGRRCESRFEQAWALRGLGAVAIAAHRPDEARCHLHTALTLYQSIGSPLVDAVSEDLARLVPSHSTIEEGPVDKVG